MIMRIGMSEPFSATINKCEIDFRVWRRGAVHDASLANNMSRKLVRSGGTFVVSWKGTQGAYEVRMGATQRDVCRVIAQRLGACRRCSAESRGKVVGGLPVRLGIPDAAISSISVKQ